MSTSDSTPAFAKMLLVDDDDVFRERLARAFGARGLVVRTASSIAAASELIAAERFEAAVIDLNLPDGSGLTLLQPLRVSNEAIRILVLTGYGSIANALQAVRLGAHDYLTKPADADQILAAIRGGTQGTPPRTTVPSLDRLEWEHIQRVLADTGGNISESARLLGIDRRSLQRKLAKFPPPR